MESRSFCQLRGAPRPFSTDWRCRRDTSDRLIPSPCPSPCGTGNLVRTALGGGSAKSVLGNAPIFDEATEPIPFAMLVSLDGSGPLARQLYRALRGAILGGVLPPGARLPSTRSLATEVGVSRNTVL